MILFLIYLIIINIKYMREIKFRAWDNKSQIMYLNPIITNYSWYLDCEHYKLNISHKDIPKGQFLMQYTGLVDKNGKEIYEGDILWDKDWGFNTKTGKKNITEVCFGRIGFEFIGKSVEYGWGNYIYHPCEVIGNIYENPELLKK